MTALDRIALRERRPTITRLDLAQAAPRLKWIGEGGLESWRPGGEAGRNAGRVFLVRAQDGRD